MPFQIGRVVPGAAASANAGSGGRREDPSAVAARVARAHHGMQPITIFFWPRVESAAAGEEIKRELVVCNDSESSHELTAEWSLEGGQPRRFVMTLAPGEQRRMPVAVRCPPRNSRLVARLLGEGALLSSDKLGIRSSLPAAVAAPQLTRRLVVYEEEAPGAVAALQQLGVPAVKSALVPDDPKRSIWLIGPGASDRALNLKTSAIREYLEQGGRVLCLAQGQAPAWSPIKLGFWASVRPPPAAYADVGFPEGKDQYYSRHAPIYAARHPVFHGVDQADLRWWSPRDGRVGDDALIRPAAFGSHARGAWRVLAGGTRLELASIVEARIGEGTLILSQAHVLEQRATAEARAVFMNMLRYLDGPAWAGGAGVRLAGEGRAEKLAELAGVAPDAFGSAAAGRGDVLIATDGARLEELTAWAEAGGTVLVLSAEVAARLPGYRVAVQRARIAAAARGEDHPLLWGLASTNFVGADGATVDGFLTAWPAEASVLFHGRGGPAPEAGASGDGRRRAAPEAGVMPPIAVREKRGKGQWVVTTIAPWRVRGPQDAEVLSTLLANAGLSIPAPRLQPTVVQVYKTAPLKWDGQLDDWTDDMEDRNVSPYCHAQPIVLSAENLVQGDARGDAELSGIVYFLWDEAALYMAGAVFGGPSTVQARIGARRVAVEMANNRIVARLDEKPDASIQLAGGNTTSAQLIDSRVLSFTQIDQRYGSLVPLNQVKAATFEARLPWSALGLKKPPEKLPALVRIERERTAILQAPVAADADKPVTWLTLLMTRTP